MVDVTPKIKTLDSISLPEMESVRLMDRVDTKFTFQVDQLGGLLHAISPHYRVLEIGGVRASRYETLYFDTDGLELYLQHHRGQFARYKIRYRKYLDSEACFFEVKAKNNKGRTRKQRISCDRISGVIEGRSEELLRAETPFDGADFKPRLWVNFTRVTFVSKTAQERLTLDLNLCYRHAAAQLSFPKLVIAEVKQERASCASHFIPQMRERRIWDGSMSKYCFGIVNLYPNVKMNLFKERVKQIKELAT